MDMYLISGRPLLESFLMWSGKETRSKAKNNFYNILLNCGQTI